jgi:hypothetical protein
MQLQPAIVNFVLLTRAGPTHIYMRTLHASSCATLPRLQHKRKRVPPNGKSRPRNRIELSGQYIGLGIVGA